MVTNVITHRGEAMRKFLMVAAVLAVTACGEKKADGADSAAMADSIAAAAAAAAPVAAPVVDSMAAKVDTMAKKVDSMAPKKP